MKFFTWMHRKLHTNDDYCMISREKDQSLFDGGKKTAAVITREKDTEALLHDRDHVTLVDVLGGWQDGILAIGTFGLDPLKPFKFQEEYSVQEEEYSIEDEEEDGGELSPLAVKEFKHELERAFGSNDHVSCINAVERQMLESRPLMSIETDNPLRLFLRVPEFGINDSEKKRKKKGERTTLADLFSADAAAADKSTDPDETPPDTGKKTAHRAKHVRSLAKKLMPWKGEDSRPTTKLHQLIRRMLKRKIHPELERKIHEAIAANDASNIEAVLGDPGSGGNESVSLLL